MEDKLSRDWFHAPAAFKGALRSICSNAERILFADFLAARDVPGILEVAGRYRQRPAAPVAQICWLAVNFHHGVRGDGTIDGEHLERIGRFVLEMHERCGGNVTKPEPPPSFVPEQGRVAYEGLVEDGLSERLAAIIDRGLEEAKARRNKVERMGQVEIEGVTLGAMGGANKIILEDKDALEEILLRGS